MVSPVENYFHQSIKTEFVIFSNKVSHQTVYTALYSNRIRLKEVDEHKHLGLIISKNLSWRKHISQKYVKRQTSI